MKITKLFLTILPIFLISTPVLAKNNQTSVLGGGIGYHFFSGSDDTREGSGIFGSADEVRLAAAYRLFGEWYPLGNFGIGLLANYQSVGRTSSINGSELKQQWSFGHYFGTINIIPFGGTSYARLGLYGGAGIATYSLDEEQSGTGSSDYNESATVDGTATTVGIYGDWGGEDFGMRAGYQYINSNYPDMEVGSNTYEITSSGGTIHFDLRWAF